MVRQARYGAQTRLRALQSDIMDLILERELEAGDPLPTENELAASLGVGRNTLRESLKVLQAMGVIEIRHGFGMFVAPSNFDAFADGLVFRGRLSLRQNGEDALQLLGIRQALETGLLPAAVAAATPGHLERLAEAVEHLEQLAQAGEHSAAADAEFHRRLFEPLGNELLQQLLGVFGKVHRRIQLEAGPATDDAAAVAALHRKIYDAVAAGDAAAAAGLLASRFEELRGRITALVAGR
ncbi:FadR/GntR family transcriptional regulator [Arthrobacter cupressi]|uniref:DNA-binding transcriptional regulator, FadR family n=1 Tax=Arthrobacter cupressi TaxID=1045773 RepID=A0A1G8V0J3_9MICC|nr:FCD domain-containing protein [Arthrobacter cupressi]NYD78729.1 DNA-binding FadR family transcriptional regulator [Arthrobacter cupressi]SDJ59622.1 DNA-binding transcriptional regulator, FadR family [Arthrobacter cupressi]